MSPSHAAMHRILTVQFFPLPIRVHSGPLRPYEPSQAVLPIADCSKFSHRRAIDNERQMIDCRICQANDHRNVTIREWSTALPEIMPPAADNLTPFRRPGSSQGYGNVANKALNVVDLFCGCGGLSLGFELYDGRLQFRSVLAVDNDPAALRVYNENFVRDASRTPTGRLADLTWFNHRSEALLYYLSHYAAWQPDPALGAALEKLGFRNFLASVRKLDEEFAAQAFEFGSGLQYSKAYKAVDSSAWNLALVRSIMGKLKLASLRLPVLDEVHLPWTQEYSGLDRSLEGRPASPQPVIVQAAADLWDKQLDRLRAAVKATGKGQHATVGQKVDRILSLLSGHGGLRLRDSWITWQGKRDSLRAAFCLAAEKRLQDLYRDGRQVNLVLGGPPCKGWSRIGRAVIESLREQGVHAWACKDYGDERNALLHKYVLFLDALQPEAFLFENVAHFQSSLRTPSGNINAADELERALNLLGGTDRGFNVSSQIVSAKNYGVPQDRNRYIMVGIRQRRGPSRKKVRFFEKLARFDTDVPLKAALLGLEDPGVFIHGEQSCSTSFVSHVYSLAGRNMPSAELAYASWIRQSPKELTQEVGTTDAHIVRRPRSDDEALFGFLAPGTRWMDYKVHGLPTGERLKSLLSTVKEFQSKHKSKELPSVSVLDSVSKVLDDSLLLRLLLEGLGAKDKDEHHLLGNGYLAKGTDHHGDWLERLSPDKPCKTIVAHIGKDTYGYIHPTQPRALSIREAARVQSFPDFFRFRGTGIVDAYTMIGNAVPPMLAHRFAETLSAMDEEDLFFPVAPNYQAGPSNPVEVPAIEANR